MLKEKICFDIIDSYYGITNKTLEDIAKDHQVSIEACQEKWDEIKGLSTQFSQLVEKTPSQISLNKILISANEQAKSFQKKPFWLLLLKPTAGLATVLVCAISVMLWQHNGRINGADVASVMPSPIQERLYSTPMDSQGYTNSYFTGKQFQTRSPYASKFITPVSVSVNESAFSIDDELEKKMMSKSLNNHELETLYFRARKYEKLGYYENALNDYLFITKYYPQFNQNDSLAMSIAKCYEEMGNKTQAIQVLTNYQKIYGNNTSIQYWIDMLKSETF